MSINLPGIKLFDLTGKSAVITGGSNGLGLAMAYGLASAGCNIMIVNKNAGEGQAAAHELAQSFAVKVLSFPCDVTNPEQTELMSTYAVEQFGKIDILINSAGINIRGPIEELSLEDFNRVMNVNVTGTWLCCKAVVPHMKYNGYGRIINLASTLGLVGLANRTPYASLSLIHILCFFCLSEFSAEFRITYMILLIWHLHRHLFFILILKMVFVLVRSFNSNRIVELCEAYPHTTIANKLAECLGMAKYVLIMADLQFLGCVALY